METKNNSENPNVIDYFEIFKMPEILKTIETIEFEKKTNKKEKDKIINYIKIILKKWALATCNANPFDKKRIIILHDLNFLLNGCIDDDFNIDIEEISQLLNPDSKKKNKHKKIDCTSNFYFIKEGKNKIYYCKNHKTKKIDIHKLSIEQLMEVGNILNNSFKNYLNSLNSQN